MLRHRKGIVVVAAIILLALFSYWGKCQLGINVFPQLQWENNIPALTALQKREIVLKPMAGERVLRTTFDEWLLGRPRLDVWARDKELVKVGLVKDGLAGSKCLRVHSDSTKDWSVQHHFLIQVQPGEKFALGGFARTTGSTIANMNVILYGVDKNVLNWTFAVENVKSQSWQRMHRKFIVPPNAYYMRFRFTGAGMGDCYFDDVNFVKEEDRK